MSRNKIELINNLLRKIMYKSYNCLLQELLKFYDRRIKKSFCVSSEW